MRWIEKRPVGDGSATVEATLVMAVVLSVVFSFTVFSMILHDRVVLKELGDYYSETLMHLIEEPVEPDGTLLIDRLEEETILRTKGYGTKEAEEEIRERMMDSAAESLLLTRLTDVTVTLGPKEGVIRYEGELKFRGGSFFLQWMLSDEGLSGSVSRDRRTDPEEFIRLLRGIVWRGKKDGNDDSGSDENGNDGE